MNTEHASTRFLPVQRPWAARLAEISAHMQASGAPPQPLQDFLKTPFPSILFGASVYTGRSDLLRNTQILLDGARNGDGNATLRTDCFHLLCQLRHSDNFQEREFYALLFHLLVEPFARVNQYAARHLTSDPPPSDDDRI